MREITSGPFTLMFHATSTSFRLFFPQIEELSTLTFEMRKKNHHLTEFSRKEMRVKRAGNKQLSFDVIFLGLLDTFF